MKWKYKEKLYETISLNWKKFDFYNIPNNASKKYHLGFEIPLVYIPKWNRCYWLEGLRYKRNKIKAVLKDPYNNRYYYKDIKDIELVIEI